MMRSQGGAQGVLHFLCVGFRDGEHQEKLAVAASLLVTLLISCWFEYLSAGALCMFCFNLLGKLAGKHEYVCNVHLSKMSPFWLK